MTPGVTPGDHELRRSRDESSDGDVEEGGSSTRGEPNPSPTPDPYPTPNPDPEPNPNPKPNPNPNP